MAGVVVREIEPADVKEAKRVFADGIMSLTPLFEQTCLSSLASNLFYGILVALSAFLAMNTTLLVFPVCVGAGFLVYRQLVVRYCYKLCRDYVVENFQADMKDPTEHYRGNGSRFWVAVDSSTGAILGTVALDHRGEKEAELRRMSVVAASRGRGVGKLLLFALEEHAREYGYTRVFLSTTTAQQPAISMYLKGGFKLVSEKKFDWWGALVFVELDKFYEPATK
eukprot:m.241449 g.241449  ORF g.241449 m.241449 type:complete len:224 (-) comp24407_c0_seq1:18-689(-)